MPDAPFVDASSPASAPRETKEAQRLLAHAKLCRDIAAKSVNKDSARKLELLAQACVRAAGLTFEVPPPGRLH